jgi:hypothetical protein
VTAVDDIHPPSPNLRHREPALDEAHSASGSDPTATIDWRKLDRTRYEGGAALRDAVERRAPVIFTDLAADWPALERWSPEQLSARYGDKIVRVYDASFGAPGRNYMGSIDRMPFAQFLEETQHCGRDLRMFLYNLSRQIPELVDDIRLPDAGPRFSRRFVFSFFGCRGSTTPLHYDIDMGDVLHTVIRGRRRIRLFAPPESSALYRHPFTVRSYVDLDAPDFQRYPALARARGFEIVLQPGETLYMPSGWWHEFHYLEAGMGVSLRAPSPLGRERLRGLGNLLFASPVDRLANRCAPERWYRWKTRRAARNGKALLASGGRRAAQPGPVR